MDNINDKKKGFEDWDSVKEIYPDLKYDDFTRFQGLIDNPYIYEMMYSIYNDKKLFSDDIVNGQLQELTFSVFKLESIIRNNFSSRITFRNKKTIKLLGQLNGLLGNMEGRQLFRMFMKDTGKENEDIYDEIKKCTASGRRFFKSVRGPLNFNIKHCEKVFDKLVKDAIFTTDNVFNIYYGKYEEKNNNYDTIPGIKHINQIMDFYSRKRLYDNPLVQNIVNNYSKIKNAIVEIKYCDEVVKLIDGLKLSLEKENNNYDNAIKYLDTLLNRYKDELTRNQNFVDYFKMSEVLSEVVTQDMKNVDRNSLIYKEYLIYRAGLEDKTNYMPFSEFAKQKYNRKSVDNSVVNESEKVKKR